MAHDDHTTTPMPGRDAIAELMQSYQPADLTEAEMDAAMRPFMVQLHRRAVRDRIQAASDGKALESPMADLPRPVLRPVVAGGAL